MSEVSPVVKRKPGRPPKYAPEEREQKYKEARDKWLDEHKEVCYTRSKEYYETHKDELNDYHTKLKRKERQALRILRDIWKTNNWTLSDDIKTQVHSLFQDTMVS
jgi:hypothetical protein